MTKRRRFSSEELNTVYDRTNGKCHLCHKTLSFKNYGMHGAKGAWHVDHSRAIANGGTNHMNNLFAACISCNLSKGTVSTKTARRWVGKTKAPLSREKRAIAKKDNAIGGSVLGAGAGGAIAGPVGALIGGVLGAIIGYDPDK